MAREKLGCIDEETVVQDLDLLEREVMALIDQQMKEASNVPAAATLRDTSKFIPANGNRPGAEARQKLSLFLRRPVEDGEKPGKSRFLLVAELLQPEKKTQPGRSPALGGTLVSGQAFAAPLNPVALQQELGQIRHAKAHQYESVARLLKGLAQGDDTAEHYAAQYHPALLKRLLKAPGPGI